MDNATQLPDVAIAYEGVDVEELLLVTSRLSDLLDQEVALLDAMKIGQTAELQQEKTALTEVLEAQKKYIASQPEVLETLGDSDRARLRSASQQLERALQRNVRMVAVAKAVNQRVVQAITETLAEQHSTGAYSRSGLTQAGGEQAISLTLNEKI